MVMVGDGEGVELFAESGHFGGHFGEGLFDAVSPVFSG